MAEIIETVGSVETLGNAEENPTSGFAHEVEQITIEFHGVLERIHYVDLIAFVMQKLKKLKRKPFNNNQLQEETYDFYGEYDTEEIVEFIEKLKKNPDLVYKYFEKHWKYLDARSFGDSLSEAERFLRCGDIELVPLQRLARQLNDETDPHRRWGLLSELERQVDEILQKNRYLVLYAYGEEKPLTRETLMQLRLEWVSQQIGQCFKQIHGFEEIAHVLQKARWELKFQETIGVIDREKLASETKMYGAKGANLQAVADIIHAIPGMSYLLKERCFIPDFQKIPVSVYRKWKNGVSIKIELESFFQWIKGRTMMVRSSAVYSEDNDAMTGAGIYKSVILAKESTIEDFEQAIIAVFESVDSERAIDYRTKNNILEEEMGIVLQEFVDYSDVDKGYVNTVVKQVPQLMDITLDEGLRPVIRKDILEEKMANDNEERSILHYQIDWRKSGDIDSIEALAMLSYLLEKHYGQALQIEFILTQNQNVDFYDSYKQIALLQTRFLPKNFSIPAQIEFPEKEYLFKGRALGVADITLNVLPNDADNSTSEGVVFFSSSIFSSLEADFFNHKFPQKGAVVVLGPSKKDFGHIETLCAEKGLFLIFSNEYLTPQEIDMLRLGIHFLGLKTVENVASQSINDFYEQKRLHLVLNGIEGRIYPA